MRRASMRCPGFRSTPIRTRRGPSPFLRRSGSGQHIDGPNLYHFYRSTSSLLDHRRGASRGSLWARLDSTYDDQTIVGKWSIPENQREYRVQYNKATGLVRVRRRGARGRRRRARFGHVAHPTLLETAALSTSSRRGTTLRERRSACA
jgi:hypothetical protein